VSSARRASTVRSVPVPISPPPTGSPSYHHPAGQLGGLLPLSRRTHGKVLVVAPIGLPSGTTGPPTGVLGGVRGVGVHGYRPVHRYRSLRRCRLGAVAAARRWMRWLWRRTRHRERLAEDAVAQMVATGKPVVAVAVRTPTMLLNCPRHSLFASLLLDRCRTPGGGTGDRGRVPAAREVAGGCAACDDPAQVLYPSARLCTWGTSRTRPTPTTGPKPPHVWRGARHRGSRWAGASGGSMRERWSAGWCARCCSPPCLRAARRRADRVRVTEAASAGRRPRRPRPPKPSATRGVPRRRRVAVPLRHDQFHRGAVPPVNGLPRGSSPAKTVNVSGGPACPATTDFVLHISAQGSSARAATCPYRRGYACMRNLEPPHPGDPGGGWAPQIVGDCVYGSGSGRGAGDGVRPVGGRRSRSTR